MQALSVLGIAGLAAAQSLTVLPTTLDTMTLTDATSMVPEPTSTSAPAPEMPSQLPTLISAGHSGPGCPQGTIEFPIGTNINGTVFKLPEFDLTTSGGIQTMTKNCGIHLTIDDMPANWQFAISQVLLSGMEYSLEENAQLRIWFDTFFSRDQPSRVTMEFDLGINGVKDLVLSVPEENRLWSTCGGDDIVNMNLRVMVDDSSVDSRKEGESTTFGTAPLLERFTYVWRKCEEDEEPSATDPVTETETDLPAPTETEEEEDECEAEEPEATETMTDDPTTATETVEPEETEEPEECEAEEPEATETMTDDAPTATEATEPEETEEPEECEAEEPEESEEP